MVQKQYEILRGKVALNDQVFVPGEVISIPEEEAARFPAGMLQAVVEPVPLPVRFEESPSTPPLPEMMEGDDSVKEYTPPKKTVPQMKKPTRK